MTRNPELVDRVIATIVSALGLDRDDHEFDADTPLLDHLPELDSMAVVQLIVELEEDFDIEIDGDEITAEVFETVGTLAAFVEDRAPSFGRPTHDSLKM